MPCQTTAHHKPISSPNTWLISGAVMKSPPAPMLPALLPVAVLGIGLAKAHVVVDRHRAVAPDALAQTCEQRGFAVVSLERWTLADAGARLPAVRIIQMPTTIIGRE